MKYLGHFFVFLLIYSCTTKESALEDSAIPTLVSGELNPMPNEWIDKDTGHRIFRVSGNKAGGRSFYFHNNPFIKGENGEADIMVYYGWVDSLRQLFTVNLENFERRQLTFHPHQIRGEIVSPGKREVFYQSHDSVYTINVDDRSPRLVFIFPENFQSNVTSVNADGTLLAGSEADPEKGAIYEKFPNKGDYFTRIYEAKIRHSLFTIDINSGELKVIHTEKAWLNHVQFSPTDPDLLMYDHEGPWHLVDRIWTINIHTGDYRLMHERTMDMEIAGHEFFSRDGKTIWYDLQLPRGETFYLAGLQVDNGESVRYKMTRDEWSIHFNISPDQKLFAGDGADSTQVAHAKNGRWIYLFTPSGDSLQSKKLVNMQHHGYRPLEPNVHFTPDGKYILFRSDLDGDNHIYAVEI